VLGISEAQVLAFGERAVDPAAEKRFRDLLARRRTGEPVAYLLGEREFYGRIFQVDSRVLIPRPETEHAVEEALALGLGPGARILDVGTGSGCLAITLALEIPESTVTATDLSPGALAVAAANARRLGAAGRVSFLAADLTAGLDLEAFDLVISNPPYVDPAAAGELSPEVRDFEPPLALFSPGRGDSTIDRLFGLCAAALRPGAPIVIEIGYGQLDDARRIAARHGLDLLGVRSDYAGIPRILTLARR
jgi:release factor glutamine methyltransferase